MNYKQVHEVEINESEKLIKFTKTRQKTECEHLAVTIFEDTQEIECKACKSKLNPIWWLCKHLDKINLANRLNNAMLSEYREIFKKLESKKNFACKSCHEVNTIDFKSLPSKAAVQRGMSVVSDDYPGWSVEK